MKTMPAPDWRDCVYLTIANAAPLLGLTKSQLEYRIRNGSIPAEALHRFVGPGRSRGTTLVKTSWLKQQAA